MDKSNVELVQAAGENGNIMEQVSKQGGTYSDPVDENTNTEEKLPTAQFPQSPDPSPFKLGPMTTGQR
jgi:hypothetical protein